MTKRSREIFENDETYRPNSWTKRCIENTSFKIYNLRLKRTKLNYDETYRPNSWTKRCIKNTPLKIRLKRRLKRRLNYDETYRPNSWTKRCIKNPPFKIYHLRLKRRRLNYPNVQKPIVNITTNHVTSDVPNHVTSDVPNHVTSDVPNHVTSDVPNHVTSDVPNHVTSDVIIDYKKWNSASTVHNYLLDDPILDYFKYHGGSDKISKPRTFSPRDSENVKLAPENVKLGKTVSKFENVFFNFILNQGNVFEDKVMSYLSDILGSKNIKQISFSQEDIPKVSKFQETVREMKKGTPIIYQGVLHSSVDNTYGSPDLIVRHDFLNTLVGGTISEEESKEESYQDHSSLGSYHYRIVDIKFHTLKLRADGTHLLNSGRMKANKGQIIVYNRIIGQIQNYVPRYSYVMGRGFTFTKRGVPYSSDSCVERLGRIDIGNKKLDKHYNEKVDNALTWLTDVKRNGHNWSLYPNPSRIELYPNMCNKYDMPYHELKSKLANKLNEITEVWNVGYKHRNFAHNLGITNWSKINNISELGIKQGGKNGIIIQKMLDFNNSTTKKKVVPDIIENNHMNWKKRPKLEFYIDFELVNNIFDDMSQIPKIGAKQHIFMIGLVVVMDNFNVKYYDFTSESLDDEGEYGIFNDMHLKIKEICDSVGENSDNVNFYHWGAIEHTIYEKMLEKYDYPQEWAIGNIGHITTLCNFLDIFKSEPVLIKGVLKFGLKNVGKGLMDHNLINVKGWEDSCSGGLEAMVLAEKCYREKQRDPSISIRSFKEMQDIIKYNEVDCQMVFQIVNYLRKHHTLQENSVNL